MLRWARVALCVLLAAAAQPLAAQSSPPATREEALRREREEKQTVVTPYQANGLERAMYIAEERVLPLLNRDGLHWKFGSLATGSGFAYGGGYRHRRLFDRRGAFTTWAAASLKKYWAVEARYEMSDLADGLLKFNTYARRHEYPQIDFFGLGPDARRSLHTTFNLDNTLVGAWVGVTPAQPVTIGGRVEFSSPEVSRGRNRRVPSIDERFDDGSAPGLTDTPNFVRTSVTAEVDYRQPLNARRGGWYRFEASHYADDDGAYTFQRFDVDVRQFASVLAERRVFAVRLAASTSDADAGARVPFYLMPTLGGHDSLRGFRDYRFRGPHALLTQAEYRFEVWSGLDTAIFYDAGKVALRRADLNFKNLEDAWGFGFRFNTDNGTILRIDAGFGSRDGKHLYIVFGDVF